MFPNSMFPNKKDKRVLYFMHEWIDASLAENSRPTGADSLDALAFACATEAAGRGFRLAEIEEQLGSDVRLVIFEALANNLQADYHAMVGGRLHQVGSGSFCCNSPRTHEARLEASLAA